MDDGLQRYNNAYILLVCGLRYMFNIDIVQLLDSAVEGAL
jgi:hypothetical protein